MRKYGAFMKNTNAHKLLEADSWLFIQWIFIRHREATKGDAQRINRIIIEDDGDTIRKWYYPLNYDYSRVIVRSLKSNEHQFHQVGTLNLPRGIFPSLFTISSIDRAASGSGKDDHALVNLIDRNPRRGSSRPPALSPKSAGAFLLSCNLESSDENSSMTYMLSSPCMRQLEYACEFHSVYNVYLAGGST